MSLHHVLPTVAKVPISTKETEFICENSNAWVGGNVYDVRLIEEVHGDNLLDDWARLDVLVVNSKEGEEEVEVETMAWVEEDGSQSKEDEMMSGTPFEGTMRIPLIVGAKIVD
jgi:hypothetical protein